MRLTFLLAAAGLAAATAAQAHHGWRWTTGDNIEVIGVVETARLGNPHGVITLRVEDEVWTVEVGQPWRNERAGLTDADFAPGAELRIEGEPSADVSDRLLKAERIWIGEDLHDLYPGRD
jgi:hypothetical protein